MRRSYTSRYRILAAIHLISTKLVIVTIAYSLGAALPMFLIIYGSQKLIARSKFMNRHLESLRKVFGVLTLLTAFFIASGYDIKFEQMYLSNLPVLQVDDINAVKERLNKLKTRKQALASYNLLGNQLPKIEKARIFEELQPGLIPSL